MSEDDRLLVRQAVSKSTSLQKDILRTLLYFDIFQHPLNVEELYSFLPSNSTNPGEVAAACGSQPLRELVVDEEHLYRLHTAAASVIARRRSHENRAHSLWSVARLMSHIIRRFPFVRAVFVSGELSKGVAGENSDIDFVIVTAERRLWICRTMLVLFKKIFLLNKKKFFCINHFISEHHLEAEEKNVYSAIEIATLKPLYNLPLFLTYREANSWVKDYLPNALHTAPAHSSRERSLFFRRFLEAFWPHSAADSLDAWLMNRWRLLWKNRYPEMSDDLRQRLFRSTPCLSTAYGQDFLRKILTAYGTRLEEFSLSPAEGESIPVSAE